MPNRLATESSPYLLQHAENPVDWHPWGEEALKRSKREDRPIFLSIGYSACHWCHVMEHESFQDPHIAAIINSNFIPIKVDREERPDLDQIYMHAVQLMTGRGGWPMSVFLTPELTPFFGGTYWPPKATLGMPGFDHVLNAVIDAWQNRRQLARDQAQALTNRIASMGNSGQNGSLHSGLLESAANQLLASADKSNGGFGDAPKFPHSLDIQLLFRLHRRFGNTDCLQHACLSLDKMAAGGIYDHLAGGFARYSVDDHWLVPHFEKMLYDNAMLANAYLDGYLVTGEERYARTAHDTLQYVLNHMTDSQGGFHSTEDADSEGEEGKFYVWSREEIYHALDAELADKFCYVYNVTEGGNFEGKNILYLPRSLQQAAQIQNWDLDQLEADMATARQTLLNTRKQRIRPSKDDKVLVNWNGLMIDAMARTGAALSDVRFVRAAEKAADFIRQRMSNRQGKLQHTWRQGNAKQDAFLDDYASLINSLVSLYEATLDGQWIEWATRLADTMLAEFSTDHGGFYYTAKSHESLIARTKDLHDSSTPSSNGLAAYALLRLGKLTGRADIQSAGANTLSDAYSVMENSPVACAQLLIALDFFLGPSHEIVLVQGNDVDEANQILRHYRSHYLPNCVLASDINPATTVRLEILNGKQAIAEQATLFVCENFSCQQPACGKHAASILLDRLAQKL